MVTNEIFHVRAFGQMYSVTLKMVTYDYGWRIAPTLKAWNAAQNASVKSKRSLLEKRSLTEKRSLLQKRSLTDKRSLSQTQKTKRSCPLLTKEEVVELLLQSGSPWSR